MQETHRPEYDITLSEHTEFYVVKTSGIGGAYIYK